MVIHCPRKSSTRGHDDADDYAGVDDVEHESMEVVIRRPRTEEADEAVVRSRSRDEATSSMAPSHEEVKQANGALERRIETSI